MSKQHKLNQTDNEVYYGTVPMLRNERVYSFWDILLATGAWAIATWCYVHGAQIAKIVGLKAAVTNTLFSMVLVGLIMYFLVIISTRHGIDIWVYQRALFGYVGVVFFAMFMIAAQFGYPALNAKVYSSSIMKIVEASGIPLSEAWTPWIASTCIIFGGWIALKGPIAVKKATRIMVPSLILVGVIIVASVFIKFSPSSLDSIQPPQADLYASFWEGYMVVTEWNIAFIFAWFVALGVFARLVKTERASYWGHIGGFSILMAVFIGFGALTSLAILAGTGIQSNDPTHWLIELGGPVFGLLSLVFIGIANITTQAVAVYSMTVSTKVIKPEWSFNKVAIFWSIWCIVLIFWGGIWEYYNVFLSVVGAVCGPAVALILVDFYLIRKQQFSMRSLYQVEGRKAYTYTKGFNIPAIISFAFGVVGYISIYDPINAVPKSDIFLFTTATGFAVIISGSVYYLLSRVKPINTYLLKDIEEQQTDKKIS